MTETKRMTEIAAMRRLLETFGADRTRWPAGERLRFAPLIARDELARKLVVEAAALDKLLDLAPVPEPARERALADRIVAEAVVAFDVGSRMAHPQGGASRARWPMRLERPNDWRAAALLAASLLIGMFTGTTGILEPAIDRIVSAAGGGADADPQQTVFDYDATDEDVL